MPQHTVRFLLGTVRVTLDRAGLGLGERGGFEAEWAKDDTNALEREPYRSIIKDHLAQVYRQKEASEPPKVSLNLASHQLMDDIEGWAKLNYLTRQTP